MSTTKTEVVSQGDVTELKKIGHNMAAGASVVGVIVALALLFIAAALVYSFIPSGNNWRTAIFIIIVILSIVLLIWLIFALIQRFTR